MCKYSKNNRRFRIEAELSLSGLSGTCELIAGSVELGFGLIET